MRSLDDILVRAKAIMDGNQRGDTFFPFPPEEAIDLAWAVMRLSTLPEGREPVAWLNADGQTVISEVKRKEMVGGPFAWGWEKHWHDSTPLYRETGPQQQRQEEK